MRGGAVGGGGAVDEEAGEATLLLGTFPAVLGGVGGVYASVSGDGVRWSAPVRRDRLGPDVHGACMAHAWCMHGACMVHAWCVHNGYVVRTLAFA